MAGLEEEEEEAMEEEEEEEEVLVRSGSARFTHNRRLQRAQRD